MQELRKKAEYEKTPSDWTVSQIKQVGQILTGGTPDTSITDYYGREFLWATPIDMGSKK
jgi:type I restriction enzyme, S subunit